MKTTCFVLTAGLLVLAAAAARADQPAVMPADDHGTPAVVAEDAPPPGPACDACADCVPVHHCRRQHKLCEWLTYRPLHRPCACTGCGCRTYPCCHPPLYTYFPCNESCACGMGGYGTYGPSHGCKSCESCGSCGKHHLLRGLLRRDR